MMKAHTFKVFLLSFFLITGCSNTPEDQLIDAIENNNLQAMDDLLEKGVDPNKEIIGFGKSTTPFFEAINTGSFAVYNKLLEEGGDPVLILGNDQNAFTKLATRINHIIFYGPDSDESLDDYEFDLIAKDLKKRGADINFKSSVNLMAEDVFYELATSMPDNDEGWKNIPEERMPFAKKYFELFRDLGANMKGRGFSGTALIYHIERSNEKNVKLLLELGVDPNQKAGSKNKPPLWYAKHRFSIDENGQIDYSEYDDSDMVELLLKYGAKE